MTRLRYLASAVTSLACLAMLTAPADAVVVIDDDFSSGYTDGPIQFQEPNGSGNGIWLGQANTAVDTTSQTVQGRGGGFLRNLWNQSATGGLLGGGADEIGNDFIEGDVIKISSDFQFTLPDPLNAGVYNFGVTDCFGSCGFNATPRAGIETGWNNFAQGAYKIFTNYGRDSNNGLDNEFGLLLTGPDIGIINGKGEDDQPNGAPVDLVSDDLRIEYTAELTDAASRTWTATELIVTNLTTATVITTASIDKPAALETFVWDSLANAPNTNPTTPVEEGVAAHPTNPGSDMWFAAQWVPDGDVLQETNVSAVRFEYLRNLPPLPGDYNGDFSVDAADYTVWRDSNGDMGADLAADGTGDDLLGVPDGDVDGFDYQFWVQQFGTVSAASATGVPEPATLGLLVAATVCVGARVRR